MENKNTEGLKKLKAKISIGHQASNVGNADVVVYSSAVNPKNPEMLEAKLKAKLLSRANAFKPNERVSKHRRCWLMEKLQLPAIAT